MRNKVDSPTARGKTTTSGKIKATTYDESHSTNLRRPSISHSTQRDWRACRLFIALVCAIAIYEYLQTTRFVHHDTDTYLHLNRPQGRPVQRANDRTNITGVGFVLLGLGPFARQLKCEAAIESLRSHGGWSGQVFLLTDAPKCYRENNVWRDCNIEATIIDVHDDLSSRFTMPSMYQTRGNRLRSKKYKTRVFELIQDSSIDVLVYMDCDMLIAEAGANGLKTFVQEYKDSFDEDKRIFVFPENNPTKINGVVHTGIFIAHRKWSKSVLQRWRDQLNTEIDASDQAAFIRAGITEYRFIDEGKYLYRPRCDRHNCLTRKPRLFNHINGARCWNQGKEAIQMLVNRWQLCTYRTHNYCFPATMAPFAMSWIPYTSCTKLEGKRTVLLK